MGSWQRISNNRYCFFVTRNYRNNSPPSNPISTGITAAASTTEAHSPLPTATIDPDPMVYDNFNNPAFDGNFNTGLWKNIDTNNTKVKQQNGVLIISREADSLGLLNTINPLKWKLDQIGNLETTMMLDRDIEGIEGGNVHTVFGYWADGQWWGAVISIYGKKGDSTAWAVFDTSDYNGNSTSVPFNTWITVRFETDPNTATISAFADGHKIDEYTPSDPEAFKQREFEVIVGVWSFGGGLVTGSIDNVRIGQYGK